MNQRLKSVETWAKKVKQGNWKSSHTKFINAQFQKAEKFLKTLSKEKIIKLYNIKNLKGYPNLLKKSKKLKSSSKNSTKPL